MLCDVEKSCAMENVMNGIRMNLDVLLGDAQRDGPGLSHFGSVASYWLRSLVVIIMSTRGETKNLHENTLFC